MVKKSHQSLSPGEWRREREGLGEGGRKRAVVSNRIRGIARGRAERNEKNAVVVEFRVRVSVYRISEKSGTKCSPQDKNWFRSDPKYVKLCSVKI